MEVRNRGRIRVFIMRFITKRFSVEDLSFMLSERMILDNLKKMESTYEDMDKTLTYVVTCEKKMD